MAYREYPASPRLTGAVSTFWEMSATSAHRQEEHRFLPERSVRLTFSVGASYQGDLPSGRLEPLPRAFLLGLGLEPLRVVSHGNTRTLGVELWPWSARQLFGWELGQRALDLTNQHPRLSRAVCALLALNDWDAARELVEDWLTGLLDRRAREPGAAVVAATRLYRSNGQVRIGSVADELSLSPASWNAALCRRSACPPRPSAV